MEYRDSLDILLRECRFVASANELEALFPGIGRFVPPLTAVRFRDDRAPRFVWGLPVVSSKRMLTRLHGLLNQQIGLCLASPTYQEDFQSRSPAELQQDLYVRDLVDLLVKTQAEGAFLRLDSILWIHLSELICRYMNQDPVLLSTLRASNSGAYDSVKRHDEDLIRLRARDVRAYAGVKARILKSLLARHEFATRNVREVFEDSPANVLAREMTLNRLVFTERPDSLYSAVDLTEAFAIKDYNLTPGEFVGLRGLLRLVILGILVRSRSGNLLPNDAYFLRIANLPEARARVPLMPTVLSPAANLYGNLEAREADDLEKMAHFLSFQAAPVRYLLYHLREDDRPYFKPLEKLGTIPKDILRVFRSRDTCAAWELDYAQVLHDIHQWDFLNVLRSRLRYVDLQPNAAVVDGRPLDRRTIAVNLDTSSEVYRRSRYGTAVFFDLIGFTDRTKQMLREAVNRLEKEGDEVPQLSLVSLSIQRIFSVRQHLERFGGMPQGFEGDAILDVFPAALHALRYVARFADNYERNQQIRYRPFEAPSRNPYRDGWRVGLASGEFSMISIMSRAAEGTRDMVQERAVGHTINRASRLNSGKKGQNLYLVSDDSASSEDDEYDPLAVFRVKVNTQGELNNNGIASFKETFEEIRDQVKSDKLRWNEPLRKRGVAVAGVEPRLRHYAFEFIFEDPEVEKVFAIRKLPRVPRLKGLEDEEIQVFEYIIFTFEGFRSFASKEAGLESRTAAPSLSGGGLGVGEDGPSNEALSRMVLEELPTSAEEDEDEEEIGPPARAAAAPAAPPARAADPDAPLRGALAGRGLGRLREGAMAALRAWSKGGRTAADLIGQEGKVLGASPSGAGSPVAEDDISELGEASLADLAADLSELTAQWEAAPTPGAWGGAASGPGLPGAKGGGLGPPPPDAASGWPVQKMLEWLQADASPAATEAPDSDRDMLGWSNNSLLDTDQGLLDPFARKGAEPQVNNWAEFGYVIESRSGAGTAIVAYHIGRVRPGRLEGSYTYRVNEFPPHLWSIEEVLRRFVSDRDDEIIHGPSTRIYRLDPLDEVHPLDPDLIARL